MSLRSAVSTAIRNRLLEIPELVEKFTDEDGTFKYYLGTAPGDTDVVSYIKSNHIFGGERPRTPRREFDILWQVAVVDTDQTIAEQWDAVIYAALVPYRLTFPDNWQADNDVTFNGSMAEADTVQGNQFWSVGAYYRIRGAKGN